MIPNKRRSTGESPITNYKEDLGHKEPGGLVYIYIMSDSDCSVTKTLHINILVLVIMSRSCWNIFPASIFPSWGHELWICINMSAKHNRESDSVCSPCNENPSDPFYSQNYCYIRKQSDTCQSVFTGDVCLWSKITRLNRLQLTSNIS